MTASAIAGQLGIGGEGLRAVTGPEIGAATDAVLQQLVSLLFLFGIFGSYRWAMASGTEVEVARTMAVKTLVAMEVFYLLSVRYLKSPSFTWVGVQGTPRVLAAVAGVVVLQTLFTYAPFMQALIDTRAPSFQQLLVCAGIGVGVVLELEKSVLRRAH